jgi:Bacterial protein of unknown function (DUF922)
MLDADAGDAGAADAGVSDEVPVFTTTTPVPVPIQADSVVDFVNNINTAMGGKGEAGHMQADIKTNPEVDSKGRVTKVNMVVNTEIVRPRWSGGRPTDSDRVLIKKAEQLIKTHEERHRDIAKDYMARAVKAMRGKSAGKAEATLKDFIKQMDKAQQDFDAKEGLLIVDFNGPNGKAGPATDVRAGPLPKEPQKKP